MHVSYFNGLSAWIQPVLGQSTTGQSQGSPFSMIIPMGLVLVMMYFLMIRPQTQRAKQQKKMLETLKAGDKVATAAGIVGVVITVKDTTVSLRSADAKMEVTKDSVTQIIESASSSQAAS